MAQAGEPKNGDYARYVEELSNRSAAPAAPAAPVGQAQTTPPTGSPGSTYTPEASGQDSVTLASRSRGRGIKAVMTIAAILVALAGLRALGALFEGPDFDVGDLIPALFLFACAFMLFKGAAGISSSRTLRLPKLPPLTTVPLNKHRKQP